jgi:hypothetical protein
MKQRFYIYRRGETFYLQDSRTGKQQSLETKDRKAAVRLLEIKRQTAENLGFNQFILKSCITTQDPLLAKRTWQTVMDQMQTHGKEATRNRCCRAMKSKSFDSLRSVKLVETTADDFLTILQHGKVSVVHYLKRLHNLALGLGWLAFPILAPRLCPRIRFRQTAPFAPMLNHVEQGVEKSQIGHAHVAALPRQTISDPLILTFCKLHAAHSALSHTESQLVLTGPSRFSFLGTPLPSPSPGARGMASGLIHPLALALHPSARASLIVG